TGSDWPPGRRSTRGRAGRTASTTCASIPARRSTRPCSPTSRSGRGCCEAPRRTARRAASAAGRLRGPVRAIAGSFLNPLLLFGLAAAAVPILIHLFTRKRPREVPFSSLEFLAEVNRSEIRRLRLRQWLLLLLRTLAVAALALAISRPALEGSAAFAR